MAEVNLQSSWEELTQLSTDVVPTQTQISGFVKNKKLDLHKCLDEDNPILQNANQNRNKEL